MMGIVEAERFYNIASKSQGEIKNIDINTFLQFGRCLFEQIEKEKETYKRLNEFITITGGKDIQNITAIKYIQIRNEGYFDGIEYERKRSNKVIDNLLEKIQELEKEIEELKKITTLYNSMKANNEDKIIFADKRYFDNGIFKENIVTIGKIFNVIDSYIEDYEKQKEYRYTGDVEDEIEVLRQIKKKIGKD